MATRDHTMMRYRVLFLFLLTLLSPAAWAAERQPANLLQLYDLALASNPVLEGRKYSIVQAEAQQDQALSKLLPQGSATGNISWNELTQNNSNPPLGQASDFTSQYQGLRGVVQARQALFDLASYRAYEGAEFTVKQAEQDLDNARMGLATNLVDRYLEFLQAHDEASYVQGELDLTEGDMQRIRRMYERTMAKVTDVYEVEAYYQTLKTRELEIHNAKAVALEKVGSRRSHASSGDPCVAPRDGRGRQGHCQPVGEPSPTIVPTDVRHLCQEWRVRQPSA
jgi:outer membrane protein